MKQNLGILVAGGTGGHVFPACATAAALKKHASYKVVAFTDNRALPYFEPYHSLFEEIIVLPGKSWGGSLLSGMRAAKELAAAFIQSKKLLHQLQPQWVWGLGGYISFMPLLVALTKGIPCGVHEANAYLGQVNRWLCRSRKCLLSLSFPHTQAIPARSHRTWTGFLVRPGIVPLPYTCPMKEGTLNLVVMGGSQGARIFGQVLPKAVQRLPEFLQRRLHLWHQCPKGDETWLRQVYGNTRIGQVYVSPFWEDVGHLLGQAHVVITRGGSSSLAECAYIQRPMMVVPLPSSKDHHQQHNAQQLLKEGGGWLMPQESFTPEALAEKLTHWLDHPETLIDHAAALDPLRAWIQDAPMRMVRTILAHGAASTYSSHSF